MIKLLVMMGSHENSVGNVVSDKNIVVMMRNYENSVVVRNDKNIVVMMRSDENSVGNIRYT